MVNTKRSGYTHTSDVRSVAKCSMPAETPSALTLVGRHTGKLAAFQYVNGSAELPLMGGQAGKLAACQYVNGSA